MSNADRKDPLQTEVSEELQVLRKMRRYTEKYTNEYIVKNMMRLEAYSTTGMGRTPEEQLWIYKKSSELLMHGAIADLYRKVLELATKKHRKEKGGAEKLIRDHRDEITAIERKLRQRHQESVAAEECKFREKMSA